MTYFVSRQCAWPDGTLSVEVNGGGLDYANPGMLTPAFRALGEGREYTDPREAAEAAVNVARAWRKRDRKRIAVAHGHTGGFTMPFEPTTQQALLAWSESAWAELPKCDHCGEALPEKRKRYRAADDYTGFEFCSESCAERACEAEEEFRAEHAADFENDNREDAP